MKGQFGEKEEDESLEAQVEPEKNEYEASEHVKGEEFEKSGERRDEYGGEKKVQEGEKED